MPTSNHLDDFMALGGHEFCLTCGAQRRWDGAEFPTSKLCQCSSKIPTIVHECVAVDEERGTVTFNFGGKVKP